jgi:hypothetical protein
VVKPDFDVLYADVLLRLNSAYYLVYGVDDQGSPVIKVQDCSYNKRTAGETGENYVPRCVKFTPQQWVDLLSAVDDVADAMQGGVETDGDDRIHIGGNTFITVKAGRGVIDIREFYLPKDTPHPPGINTPESFYNLIYPTKRGVQLSAEGWSLLVSKGADLIDDFAGCKISVNQPCFINHAASVEELYKCAHCNPNGYTDT